VNIFARELAILLAKHGKDLSSLYSMSTMKHKIYPNKVTLLKLSLTQNKTATLNAEDLEMLAEVLKLPPNGKEMKQLRAALLAETVRYLLGGRMDIKSANDLGEVTFQLLLGKDPDDLLKQREDLLTNMREDDIEEIDPSLEIAAEIYGQGALWLEVARDTHNPGMRQSYLASALSLLHRAKDLINKTQPSIEVSSQQQEWLKLIEATIREATAL
jgi:hypothetical protein